MTRKKIKILPIPPEEEIAVIRKSLHGMESATLGQLQGAIFWLAQSLVEASTNCSDKHVKYTLAMQLITHALNESRGVVSLIERDPVTGITN